MEAEPGLLSDVLKIIAQFGANILTIHQSIPINGVASLSLSIQVLPTTGDVSDMLEAMEAQKGVRNVKLLAKEYIRLLQEILHESHKERKRI